MLVLLFFHGKIDAGELYIYSEVMSKRRQQRI